MENTPPPPYSVTDSNSAAGSVQPRPPTLSTTTSNVDDASVSGQCTSEYDAASSIGDPTIYTPPYTPDGDQSGHLESVPDGLENTSSHASALAASAQVYFESRPVSQFSTHITLFHLIDLAKNTQPSDIPFPEPEKKWLEKDVLPQDWETFVNYLIPHYIDTSNHHVAERKLNAVLIYEGMDRLTLDQSDKSETDLQQVNAQLEPLRQSHAGEQTQRDVRTVIEMWNEGFFGPRGVRIEISDATRAMPGSWTEDPVEATGNVPDQASACGSARGFGRSWFQADENGFRFGRNMLSADHNGFRLGNFLVADRQGIQLGPFGRGTRGLGFGRGNMRFEHHRGFNPEHHAVRMPPHFRGRPPGRYPSNEGSQRDSHRASLRDRSHSTSSSSSSGASSLESAGSLPDYDHLKDVQLPVAKQAIRDWLNHPDQPITKQAVRQIRQEIKAAKSGSGNINGADRDSLKKEVRELFKEFKAIKKSQQKAWKAAKRERRSLRREARRTRKAARRDVRRADREVKHADREAEKAARIGIKVGKRREGIFDSRAEGSPDLSENYYQGPSDPQFGITHPHLPFLAQTGSPFDGRSWPSMADSQAANPTRAAMLQAEGRRIEAEARREEAHRRAVEARQKALDQATASRSRNEDSLQQSEAKAAFELAKAETTATLARGKAELYRQRAEANARIVRMKAEANRMLAGCTRMLADVNKMRIQAQQLQDRARSKLLRVAGELEEEAEKMKKEGEHLMAESEQAQKELVDAYRDLESSK